MRITTWKIPEIALLHVLDKTLSLIVKRGDPRSASEHHCPFSGIVPMKFANTAGGQAHVHSGDILGDWKVCHRHLPGPATWLNAPMLDGERIPE